MNSEFRQKITSTQIYFYLLRIREILRWFAKSKLLLHAFHAYFAFTSYNIKLLKEKFTKSHDTFLSQCLCPGGISFLQNSMEFTIQLELIFSLYSQLVRIFQAL